MKWDVVVVGAGPAGSLASRELSRKGASVLLLDRADFPRWKVCGACLSRGGRQVLEEVGLEELTEKLGAVPLQRLVLTSGTRAADVRLDGPVSVSRSTLDRALVDEAESQGVHFWSGARARSTCEAGTRRRVSVQRGSERTEVEASVVIDATGLGAGVGGSASTESRAARNSRIGLGAVFDGSTASTAPGEIHMVVGRAGYVGLVRLEDGRLNVAAAVDAERLRTSTPGGVVAGILSEGGRRLPEGDPLVAWKGTPALTRTPARLGAHRLFRLGDSAGYVEPFTGEGMCWALSGATVLVPFVLRALDGWSPAPLDSWERYQRRVAARSKRLCRVFAWALRRPMLARTTVRVLGVAPALAGPFICEVARAPAPLRGLAG